MEVVSPREAAFIRMKAAEIQISMIFTIFSSIVIGILAIVFAGISIFSIIIPAFLLGSYLLIPTMMIVIVAFFFPFVVVFGCKVTAVPRMRYIEVAFGIASLFIALSIMNCAFIAVTTLLQPQQFKSGALNNTILNYHRDGTLASRIDSIQRNFECCGIDGIHDWNMNTNFTCEEENASELRCNIPQSCCVQNNTHKVKSEYCSQNALNESFYKDHLKVEYLYVEGCLAPVTQQLNTVFAVTIVVLFFLTGNMVFFLQLLHEARKLYDPQYRNRAFLQQYPMFDNETSL